jgi:hypothetical protein
LEDLRIHRGEDLFDGGKEVMEGADWGQGWTGAEGSAGGGQEEGGAQDSEGDTLEAELSGEISVLSAGTDWGPWEGAVGVEDGLEVEAFLVGVAFHFFFFFLAAASF